MVQAFHTIGMSPMSCGREWRYQRRLEGLKGKRVIDLLCSHNQLFKIQQKSFERGVRRNMF